MKSIVLALALSAASDPHSLGLGLDVVPEAFATAASRVHAQTVLRGPRCGALGCRWDYGDGVVIEARLLEGTLSVARLEAVSTDEPGHRTRFHEACRAIVALVRPREASSRRNVAVDVIAAGGEDPSPFEGGVVLFGKKIARQPGPPELRCGATPAE